MKYTYKRTIEIETQDEQPLLGYDIQKVAYKELDQKLTHALKQAVEDGRATQTIKVGDKTFVVHIQDQIRHIK